MKTGQPFSRREFLKTTGGALSLLTVAVHLPSALANATESDLLRVSNATPHLSVDCWMKWSPRATSF